jgi:hypothetical protein
MAEMARGKKIGTALKKAARQVPQAVGVLAENSIPDLKKYYAQLERMEQEMAIAENMRVIAAMRKQRAQQGQSS